MNSIIAMIVTVSIIFSGFWSYISSPATVVSTPQLVISIPVGNGIDMAGYSPMADDIEKEGPNSFCVSESGNIFVLDTIHDRVLQYVKSGKYITSYNLPSEYSEYLDIEVIGNDDLFVLSYTGEILEMRSGAVVQQYSVNFDEALYTAVGLFKDKNNDVVFRNLVSGDEQYIKSGLKKSSYLGMKMAKTAKNGLLLDTNSQQITIDYTYTPSVTQPLYADDTKAIMQKTEALIGKSIYTETKLLEISNGKIARSALAMEINGNYARNVPHKYLYYCNSGAYQMTLHDGSVDIYSLPFAVKDQTRISKELVAATFSSETNDTSANLSLATAQAGATRTQAFWNCDDMVVYNWSFNASTMKTASNTTTTCPPYLKSLTGTTTQTGIPYCWGGTHGNVSACGYASFASALGSGNTAGNTLCTGSYKSGTAGLDCSGFISVGYRLDKRYNTSQLVASTGPFTLCDVASMMPGDIYDDAGSHVVMYTSKISDLNGNLVSYGTKECTTSGSPQNTKNYSRSITSIQNSYKPYTLK